MYVGQSSERRARKGRKTARTVMTSSYLTRPKIPLAAALSQMLESIEADLTDGKLDAVQTDRLRWRVELIRSLLTPSRIT
jgi:hypothetical protein